ncbi:caskin-1 isoform X2 [Lingula anatina]|uniref:Caskin-1 isoform X2 n=1 Tax=Lingula anatina TaxID=7574 RepID=A0A1S3HMB3_LINAN|nr:caskin-1 isoform X2 [Lingula anatina]|eukprot:XP_013386174.1 caskin-1 isoform X2 [Lingula anatina]
MFLCVSDQRQKAAKKCGVDVNRPNSYDQSALDIVNKFTTSRAAKELKQLLKEASCAVQACAIKDYSNIYDPNSLSFREGDYITVLEQRADGMWKGFVMHEGQMAKTGFFPASAVVLVDRQSLENRTQSLRGSMHGVSPVKYGGQQVPDLINRNHSLHNGVTDRNSYGSVGADESFPPPPSPMTLARNSAHEYEHQQPAPVAPVLHPGPLPSPHHLNSPRFNFVNHNQMSHSPKPGTPGTPDKTFDWPPRHLDGGDMRSGSPLRSGSPCKSSPCNSNRNSSASIDSGRSLGSSQFDNRSGHIYVNHNQHRLSGQSYESGLSSRQSYHSTSSSSMGSLDRLEESGYSSQVNVAELFQAGYTDHEVLHAWLCDLHFEEYFNLFVQAGYDMGTITHMTPQDLTAIGITKPGHRKKLKAEISKLNLHDGIPDYKPNDLYEWLQLLRLEQYYDTLAQQGYDKIDMVTDIMWEDMEDVGISLLGHQKKFMLAIDRLKRIQSGAGRRLSSMERQASAEMLDTPPSPGFQPPPSSRWSADMGAVQYHPEGQYQVVKPKRSPSGDSMSSSGSAKDNLSSFHQLQQENRGATEIIHLRNSSPKVYQPDVVAIQVNRSLSRSGTSDGLDVYAEGQNVICRSFQAPPENKYKEEALPVDGEVTPTNELNPCNADDSDHAGSLGRPSAAVSPRVVVKPKPVAKIVAKTKRSSRDFTPEIIPLGPDYCSSGDIGSYATLRKPLKTPKDSSKEQQSSDIVSQQQLQGNSVKSQKELLAASIAQSVANRKNMATSQHNSQPAGPGSPKSTSAPLNVFTNGPIVNSQGSPRSPTTGHHQHSLSAPVTNGPNHIPSASSGGHSKPPANSSHGKNKKPPPPPKRTNSIKSDTPVVVERRHHSFSESPKSSHRQQQPQAGNVLHTPSLQKSSSASLPQHNSTSSVPAPQKLQKSSPPQKSQFGKQNSPVTSSSHKLQSSNHAEVSQTTSQSPKSPVAKHKQQQQNQQQQQPDFQDCVKSLALKFNKPKTDSLPSPPKEAYEPPQTEEFPPPPPPIATDISPPKKEKDLVNIAKANLKSPQKLSKPQQKSPKPEQKFSKPDLKPAKVETKSAEHRLESKPEKVEQKAEVKPKMSKPSLPADLSGSDSGSSSCDEDTLSDSKKNGSSSSNESINSITVDSNTLPFANENVGTIKQKNAPPKPSIVQFNMDGDADLNNSLFDGTGTIKRAPAKHSTEAAAAAAGRGQMGAEFYTGDDFLMDSSDFPSGQGNDVLDDIGNMLQGLTDELDAMLDDEI